MGRYWTPEQVEKKRAYFQKERTEQEGIFTELVVRMYYLTYRAIAANGGDCCSTKEVKPYRVKDEIYEGLGDRTTTSGRSVINDSMEHLRLMRYIRMKKDDKVEWMIYLNRPLDFLLPGEHEKYLEKYGITGDVRFLEQE